jgi:hypothetical protein
MLERESFGSGWQVTLRAKGVARFLLVAFMCVWLCGWAAGEFFAGGVFIAGLRDLLAPGLDIPWLPHMKNAAPANPWPVLAFLGFWLTFWTIGGLAAVTQLGRALFGADIVRWDHDGIEVVERAGPFAWSRRLAWADAHEVFPQNRGRLVAHTRRGLVTIASMGSGEERAELAKWLAAAWRDARGGEAESRETSEQPPMGWVVETAEDGRPMLASDLRPRRLIAALVAVLALSLAAGAVSQALSARGPVSWVGASMFALLALLAAAGAAWLALGRVELRPAPGQLRRVKRFLGNEWTRELSPARLQLERARDSDGDDRWTLVARGPNDKFSLASDLYVPGGARHMGLWLAARMAVELEGLPEGESEQRRAG